MHGDIAQQVDLRLLHLTSRLFCLWLIHPSATVSAFSNQNSRQHDRSDCKLHTEMPELHTVIVGFDGGVIMG